MDLKEVFDSVDRFRLIEVLQKNGTSQKYVGLIKAIYAQTINQVRVYGEFTEWSLIRMSTFTLFNFVMDEILNTTVDGLNDMKVELASGNRLCDMEYADDVACFLVTSEDAQMVLDRLGNATRPFGMRFAPAKCKSLLQDWTSSVPSLMLNGESLEIVQSFTYLGSTVTGDGSIGSEIDARISKANAAYGGMKYLWHNRRVSLKVKGCVYNASVRLFLLYGCETWSLRSEDVMGFKIYPMQTWWQIGHSGGLAVISYQV